MPTGVSADDTTQTRGELETGKVASVVVGGAVVVVIVVCQMVDCGLMYSRFADRL